MTRTLADLLRDRTDDELVALFRLRPDLIVPVPSDLSVVAERVRSRSSVGRALDQLDRFHLEILDAVRLARGQDQTASLPRVLATATQAGAEPGAVRAALARLRDYLLVYGPDEALRVVDAVDDVAGPYPAGLGRPASQLPGATAALVSDPARLRRAVMSAPPAARAVLERLAAEGPVGALGGRTPGATPVDGEAVPLDREPVDDAATAPVTSDRAPLNPVAWLVEHHLLAVTSATTVELPREVGVLLRRDRGPLGELHPLPPTPATTVDPAAADAAGAGQVMEAVRQAEALLEALAGAPAPLRRGGGIGVRDLRRLARAAAVPDPVAGLLLEAAHAAGLVGEAPTGGRSGTVELLPAAGYDRWRASPLATRWHQLVTGWWAMTRAAFVGGRPGPLAGQGGDTGRAGVPGLHRTVLKIMASLPAGSAPTPDEAVALLTWRAPRRTAGREAAVREALAEAAHLGVTGRGALTSYGAALVAELTGAAAEPRPAARVGEGHPGRPDAVALLDRLLPEPVSEVLVQADLTVVVPGPPEPLLAAELDLVADLESAGGATVHRVTRGSVRRALDAGYSAGDLHAMFARRSRTPVPQALTYLIDDVARAHGGLRVGTAGAYLRSDDESLLVQVLADRRLAPLELRRLAPTVLVSPVSSGRLLAALRDAGYAPVPEDVSGAAVLVRPRGRRAPAHTPTSPPADPFVAARLTTARLRGIVEDVRRGDKAARMARLTPGVGNGRAGTAGGAQAHTEAMAVLQQAIRDRATVLVGYVDARGRVTSRLLRPVSIGAGYLRAHGVNADTLHTVALHRITGATLAPSGSL